jgi:hypothetical protein
LRFSARIFMTTDQLAIQTIFTTTPMKNTAATDARTSAIRKLPFFCSGFIPIVCISVLVQCGGHRGTGFAGPLVAPP